MSEQTTPPVNLEVKKLNYWLIVLSTLMLLWIFGIFFHLDKQPESQKQYEFPIILIDSQSGKIVDSRYTNLFQPSVIAQPSSIITSTNAASVKQTNVVDTTKMFEKRSSYEVGEFVIINYFYVGGVIKNKMENDYTILYMHNGKIESIQLSKEFLISPTSERGIDPFTLIR